MITELNDSDFPAVYEAFVVLFPDRPWLKRVSNLKHQINETPLLRLFLWKRNVLTYGLWAFDSYGMQPLDVESWEASKQAMIFASQILYICRHSSPENANKLCGRARHAIKDPDGMRGLQFELTVATHLSREGCEIIWMEEDTGGGVFDMMVMIPDVGAVEVECKSLSADRGESLTEETFQVLTSLLLPLIEPKLRLLKRHVYGISFIFSSKIPESAIQRAKLVAELAEAVGQERSELSGVCSISVGMGTFESMQQTFGVEELHAIANDLLGHGPGYRLMKELDEQTFLVIDIQSRVPSKFEAMLGEVAKSAVRDQMTGTRPGCLVIRVERHSGSSLESFSEQELNSLAQRASKLLTNPDYAHLASVVFVSASSMTRIGNSSEGEQSRTYVFDNSIGSYPNLGLSKLFGVAPQEDAV
ncbi:hypothetical protein DOZ80_10235 [Pseudomonas fluorescens]|uniref:Uncharacterized protein n=1 Tax=Pseudomonas fluorescens TaxID=294 RepID=A0A327N6F3_PSEFL|nr:hypothetical protein [Pseudomonas fluorescens]RAI70840.1 hypothetical protein DOZ80_10235 [Pseudomonas fluorescens]